MKTTQQSYLVTYQCRKGLIHKIDVLPAFWGDPETDQRRLKLAIELHLRTAHPGSKLIDWEVNRRRSHSLSATTELLLTSVETWSITPVLN